MFPFRDTILLAFVLSLALPHLIAGELKSISILFRHGHRKPLHSYPNNPNANFKWNVTEGLTDLGQSQMLNLGKRLRKEYRTLLHRNGNPGFQNSFIRSSFLDRTKFSAKLFAQTFFKTNEPAPVTVVPFKEDNLILQYHACPKYDRIKDQVIKIYPKAAADLMALNSKSLRTLSKRSGMKLNTIADATSFFDAVHCEMLYNLTQPDWIKEMPMENQRDVMAMHLDLYSWTEFMKKAKAGPLITEIVETMFEVVERRRMENIFIYAGHDLTLSTLTRTLKLDAQLPKIMELGSAIVFELHDIEGVPVVKIRWFDADSARVRNLLLDSCGDLCPLSHFNLICEPFYIDNYEQFCKL